MNFNFLDLSLFFIFLFVFFLYFGLSSEFFLFFKQGLLSFLSLELTFFVSSYFSFFVYVIIFFLCLSGFLSYFKTYLVVMGVTVTFILILWLASFFFFIFSSSFMVHFTKHGEGFFFGFMMCLIELVSEFSRPVSLTVRLFINLLVGHFLIIFVYSLLEGNSFYFFFSSGFLALEIIVFSIQVFIFSRLIFLYCLE